MHVASVVTRAPRRAAQTVAHGGTGFDRLEGIVHAFIAAVRIHAELEHLPWRQQREVALTWLERETSGAPRVDQ
jgi:hypothetical protein